jgi:hypoxanthine phosphoribosyltransferase
MSLLQIHDKEFELFISKKELNTIVERLATKMEYLEKDSPIFIVVLNGSFFFATDLLKSLSFDSQVHFIKVKSYQGIKSSGEINLLLDLNVNIEQRTIVIVEDIVDTGTTLHFLMEYLKKKKPKKILTASLLFKPKAYQQEYTIDFIGKSIANEFVVGYGLDYDELGRTLPQIFKLKQN